MSPIVSLIQSNARPRFGACEAPAFGLAGSEVVGGILGYRAEKWVRSMFLARMLSDTSVSTELRGTTEDALEPNLDRLTEGTMSLVASHLLLIVREGGLVNE